MNKRQHSTVFLLTAIIIFVCTLIFFVWSRLQITHLGYQISQANREQQQLHKRNKELKLEAASLASLSRIEEIAKSELGLIEPKPHQVVFIK